MPPLVGLNRLIIEPTDPAKIVKRKRKTNRNSKVWKSSELKPTQLHLQQNQDSRGQNGMVIVDKPLHMRGSITLHP
jgi:hypothetical protein